ncbi:ribonuclease P protein component [bacterium]|nr:ribonuclease P protein component [bacterium]
MTKLARLSKNDDFDACIKNGLKIYAKSFTIFIKKNKLNRTRLGISVSKKVNKSSVIRNLIRRQIKS